MSVKQEQNLLGQRSAWLAWLQDKANGMIKHLASLAEDRLIISFAPKTLAYSILKRIGELFPGPSKVKQLQTRAMIESGNLAFVYKWGYRLLQKQVL